MNKYFALLALVVLLAQETFQYHQTKFRRSVSQSNRKYECGVKRRHIVGDLIINGSNAKAGEWPWHAAVFQRKNRRSREYICGATLIHQNFVVTVSHCVVNRNSGHEVSARLLTVDFGNVQLLSLSSHGQTHNVHEIFVNPNFTIDSNKHDVAILSLESTVSFSNYVIPICICLGPNSCKTNIHDIVGEYGVVVGWGLTEEDVTSTHLKQANVPVVDHAECLDTDPDLFGPMIYPGMFCAGYRNRTNVCNGDSGGGMYFDNERRWFLRGITSFSDNREVGSYKCDIKKYAGFINVQYYATWINDTLHNLPRKSKDMVYGFADLSNKLTTVTPLVYPSTESTRRDKDPSQNLSAIHHLRRESPVSGENPHKLLLKRRLSEDLINTSWPQLLDNRKIDFTLINKLFN